MKVKSVPVGNGTNGTYHGSSASSSGGGQSTATVTDAPNPAQTKEGVTAMLKELSDGIKVPAGAIGVEYDANYETWYYCSKCGEVAIIYEWGYHEVVTWSPQGTTRTAYHSSSRH